MDITKDNIDFSKAEIDEILKQMGFLEVGPNTYQNISMGVISFPECDLYEAARQIYHLGKRQKCKEVADVLDLKQNY
ncbi:hypothetical protein JGH11_03450 [Dysgonomonas sp. Marseille-P4677]|uniref:hypothetical protein n=1 Tax=Dysgonomonas sp. Marseille-P4677 TaxID=2364790 RepID=UPI001913C71C|nr:hypothetical protein [Dysgonomonas sp. Marseille-P4677]MBK5719919.1 hypothetical protein [Dysgonomonas sp. Marseille-P4677]